MCATKPLQSGSSSLSGQTKDFKIGKDDFILGVQNKKRAGLQHEVDNQRKAYRIFTNRPLFLCLFLNTAKKLIINGVIDKILYLHSQRGTDPDHSLSD